MSEVLIALGVESLETSIIYIRESSYEDELAKLVYSVEGFKDNNLAASRLRGAWRQGCAALRAIEQKKACSSDGDDLDEPFSYGVRYGGSARDSSLAR